jgi:hypothetical protein
MRLVSELLVLLALLGLAQCSVAADGSPPVPLDALLAGHAPPENSEFLQAPGDMFFQNPELATTSVLACTGERRPISEERQHFLEAYFERVVKRAEWSSLYQEEILCVQDTKRYWLPLQRALLEALVRDVAAPATLAIDVRWLGAYRARAGDLAMVFIISDFDLAESPPHL